jgi:hypothetical protein
MDLRWHDPPSSRPALMLVRAELTTWLGECPVFFNIAPGLDSWVLGDELYVSLHFMGASDYANRKQS